MRLTEQHGLGRLHLRLDAIPQVLLSLVQCVQHRLELLHLSLELAIAARVHSSADSHSPEPKRVGGR